MYRCTINISNTPGADPGFQVREGALKKIAPSGGRCKSFGVYHVKNHDFTPKKSNFFQLRREVQKFLGFACEKSRFYAQKIIFFPILGGGGAHAGCTPPLDPPQHTFPACTCVFPPNPVIYLCIIIL